MLPATLHSPAELTELIRHRKRGSISIYLPSTPVPSESEAVQLALKNVATEAVDELERMGIEHRRRTAIAGGVRELAFDREFWQHQGSGLAVFASDGELHSYRMPDPVKPVLSVNDRYEIGPLLRAVAFPRDGHALAITEGGVHLYELTAEQHPVELPLSGLPHDLHTVLEYTSTPDQADMPRPAGANGQKTEQQRYCRIVQSSVLERIGGSGSPLILCASRKLGPAYRAVNTYPQLLGKGIDAHPDSLSLPELGERSRALLDEHYGSQLRRWREEFGSYRSKGKATTRLPEVARAATAGAIAELLFDMEATAEGVIDEQGVIRRAEEPGPESYGIVDEIAARVLDSGGSVRAVRNRDLIDGSPVAAVLRYPLAR